MSGVITSSEPSWIAPFTGLSPRAFGLAPLFGVSKSTADRVIDDLGPRFALRPRQRFAKEAVLIVDGILVPTRDQKVAEQSKNYRYSTNHQVVIDADTRLVVVVGRAVAGNRNDYRTWAESGAKAAVGNTTTIAMAAARVPGSSCRTAAARERIYPTGNRHTTSPNSRFAPASSTPTPG
ncbi:hypothetical protein GCM10010280_51330 [Streptomyces pilosus]|uniref:Transposase n=1 Tax=Streptomyces pilosus TaxID=28893 RepID=A0A918BYU2_9ACTN|nr:hypothetical protein GCM10010280_51330 [Streptomyces pilosus]